MEILSDFEDSKIHTLINCESNDGCICDDQDDDCESSEWECDDCSCESDDCGYSDGV